MKGVERLKLQKGDMFLVSPENYYVSEGCSLIVSVDPVTHASLVVFFHPSGEIVTEVVPASNVWMDVKTRIRLKPTRARRKKK